MNRPRAQSSQTTRILAPDLARGLALFSIAWANIATAWSVVNPNVLGWEHGGVINGSVLDQITVVLSAMFAHVRGLPMFTMLLGFGVGLIAVSLSKRGYPAKNARFVLWRRYGLLALFGAIHCVLLFFGDIMFLYGLLAMILIAMLTLRNKTLLWIAGILATLHVILNAGIVVAVSLATGPVAYGAMILDVNSYGEYVQENLRWLGMYVAALPFSALSMLPLLILGFVAARIGVHHQVERYSRTLKIWAGIAIVIVIGVGLPWGLASIGFLPEQYASVFSALNQTVGYFSGPGIAAIVLLVAQPLQRRGSDLPLPVVMVAALGKRSMSGYLFQSFVFVPLMLPFTLNVGAGAGAFQLMLWALGVWLLSVLLAYGLERAGLPGPFEWAHRRLAYGRDGLTQYRTAQVPA